MIPEFKAIFETIEHMEKNSFVPAGPPPGQGGGGMPPMDPAMMEQMAMQQGGMDPAMMEQMAMQQGGMPPMDPAMMEQMAMQQGGMPMGEPMPPPPSEPELPVGEIIQAMEQLGSMVDQLREENATLKTEMNDMRKDAAKIDGKLDAIMSMINSTI